MQNIDTSMINVFYWQAMGKSALVAEAKRAVIVCYSDRGHDKNIKCFNEIRLNQGTVIRSSAMHAKSFPIILAFLLLPSFALADTAGPDDTQNDDNDTALHQYTCQDLCTKATKCGTPCIKALPEDCLTYCRKYPWKLELAFCPAYNDCKEFNECVCNALEDNNTGDNDSPDNDDLNDDADDGDDGGDGDNTGGGQNIDDDNSKITQKVAINDDDDNQNGCSIITGKDQIWLPILMFSIGLFALIYSLKPTR